MKSIKTRIAKAKSTLSEHKPELVSVAIMTAGAAVVTGLAYYASRVSAITEDVIIPAHLIEHLKQSDGGVLGVDMVPGYDILINLIPVHK